MNLGGVRQGLLVALLGGWLAGSAVAEVWVQVDTRAQTLQVLDGDRVLDNFGRVALGVAGAGLKLRRGDDKTPLGSFRVGWLNPRSRFGLFIGLDYPNRDYAEAALRDGRIDSQTHGRIVAALDAGHTPPQDTPLGGQIGIHGLGAGNPEVHGLFNWTNGCVALTDAEMRRLAKWIEPGTRVEIR
ncbi:L,D-transpeptidase family protein [Marinobacterium rhizophilum]|uniref:L,D-transpeptidase n=1 Tax=Marinobacterium rhizophilum TaxID=420402 RepID=A0ABY5HG11_9GAMM|nr:L,D-transpeptidase [Marinobacterium rhizophilum]UTW10533.1 L,D-transpeptidase [Marinobacterium rhizophilum]